MKYTRTVFTGLKGLAGDTSLALKADGGCMAPEIEPGSTIGVRAARRYLPGDIVVLYDPEGRLVVHRLLLIYRRRRRWRALTRADKAPRPDAAVPVERIVGKVQASRGVSARVRVRSLSAGASALCRRLFAKIAARLL